MRPAVHCLSAERRARWPALFLSALVLVACGRQPATDEEEGYYLRFPDSVTATAEVNGGADIAIGTNLPEGTYATVAYGETETQSSGYTCCPKVKDGILQITVNDQSCYFPFGSSPSSGFRVTVTVVPDAAPLQFECLNPDGCSHPQNPSVQEILGPKFEHLTGDQVTNVRGMRALVGDASYDWPPGACDAHYASGGFLPKVCKTGYGDISEESVGGAAATLVGIFQQLRLCELYDDGTDGFRSAHPWPEFLGRTRGWIEGLGPLVAPDGSSVLRAEVIRESTETFEALGKKLPVSFVAAYTYEGRKVAEAEFVETGPRAPNIVPKWQFTRLDLY